MRNLIYYLFAIIFSFFLVYFFINFGTNIIFLTIFVFFVSFLTFQSPSFALYILVISMLLSPEFKVSGVPGRSVDIRFDDFMLIIIFITYLFKMAMNKELGLLKSSPLNINLLSLIIIMLISTLLGVLSGEVNFKKAFFYLLKMVEYYILFFLTLNNIKNDEHVRNLINLMCFVSFIVCTYAYTQIFAGFRSTAPFEGGPADAEPASFGGYLIVIYGQLIGLIIFSKKNLNKILAFLLFAFSIFPLFYSESRATYVGMIVFFVILLSLLLVSKKSKLIYFTVFLTIGITSIIMVPQIVKNRIAETFIASRQENLIGKNIALDGSSIERITSWKNIIFNKIPRRPILGYGITGLGFIDSQYFLYLAEIGIVGLIVFFILIYRIYKFSFETYILSDENFEKGIAFGLICSLSGLLIHALTSNTFIIIRIMEPFWFLVACLMFIYTKNISKLKRECRNG